MIGELMNFSREIYRLIEPHELVHFKLQVLGLHPQFDQTPETAGDCQNMNTLKKEIRDNL